VSPTASKLAGLRRVILCALAMAFAAALCGLGKMTGAECASVLTTVALAFAGSDAADKVGAHWRDRPAPTAAPAPEVQP